MSNMSYCRFENTLPDLEDCYEALQGLNQLEDLSESEKEAAERLIKLCAKISKEHLNLLEVKK